MANSYTATRQTGGLHNSSDYIKYLEQLKCSTNQHPGLELSVYNNEINIKIAEVPLQAYFRTTTVTKV